MQNREYYESERFIWDEISRQVERDGIPALYRAWRAQKRIAPFLILWPASAVPAKRGDKTVQLEGPCLRDLPEEKAEWRRQMVDAIKLTNAYAILRTEQRTTDVLLILESHHGVKNWRLPIVRSGDAVVLGPWMERAAPLERLKLLWTPRDTVS